MGHVGEPGLIVDDDLEMIIAETGLVQPGLTRATKQTMTAPVGDPAELLVVLVDEGARVVMDVADRHP